MAKLNFLLFPWCTTLLGQRTGCIASGEIICSLGCRRKWVLRSWITTSMGHCATIRKCNLVFKWLEIKYLGHFNNPEKMGLRSNNQQQKYQFCRNFILHQKCIPVGNAWKAAGMSSLWQGQLTVVWLCSTVGPQSPGSNIKPPVIVLMQTPQVPLQTSSCCVSPQPAVCNQTWQYKFLVSFWKSCFKPPITF